MTNKYLEKVAETAKKKQGIGRAEIAAGGALAAGGVLASGAPSRILGYHNVHHGTSKDLAKKIQKGGLDPSRGGTRNSKGLAFENQSKGKIHYTKSKPIAYVFSGNPGKSRRDGSPNELSDSLRRARKEGKVLTAKVPHSTWRDMKADPDMGRGANKNIAATYDKKIGTDKIVGGKGYKGRRQYASKENLKSYLSTASGKKRAAAGVARGAAGLATAGLGAKHIKDSIEKKANKYLEKIAEKADG